MIKLEIVSTRQTDTTFVPQFFNSDMGIKEYIISKFQDTGKLIEIYNSVNEDYTTETKVFVFNTYQDYKDFANDKVLDYQKTIRTRYNDYYNIRATESVKFI